MSEVVHSGCMAEESVIATRGEVGAGTSISVDKGVGVFWLFCTIFSLVLLPCAKRFVSATCDADGIFPNTKKKLLVTREVGRSAKASAYDGCTLWTCEHCISAQGVSRARENSDEYYPKESAACVVQTAFPDGCDLFVCLDPASLAFHRRPCV